MVKVQLENLIGFQGKIDQGVDLLKSILDLNPNCIFVKNKKGQYILANDAAARVAGLEDGNQMIGKYDKDLPYLHHRAESFLSDDNEILSKGIDVKMSRDLTVDKSGTEHWFQVMKRPIKNKKGEIELVLGVATDITEKVKTEETLKKKLEELQGYIDSNSELIKFASVASHDMKEPLRQIYNFSELLKNNPTFSGNEAKYIDIIHKTSFQMIDLVDDLLEYARVDNVFRKREKISLNDVLKQIEATFHQKIADAEAEISYDSLPELYGVSSHFVQLFQNLLSNAIKFRKEGVAPKIEILHKMSGDKHLFSVIDNGIGIEPKDHAKVFEVFKRLHNKNEYDGTGIGLATCKKIVERYNGTISIDKKYKKGTKIDFTIYE